MNEPLSKRQRLQRTIAGGPVDRLPWSLWRHFYEEETAAEPLARRLAEWHRRWDFDLCKINVRAQYHTEGWGGQFRYPGGEHAKPEAVRTAVRKPADFADLAPLDPADAPLAEMLELIGLLRGDLGDDEVLLMTVFNPMSVALDMIGGPGELARAIEADAGAVHKGLRAVTDTFADFATACIDGGADGLYFATTHAATGRNFSLEQYEEFGRPYDLEVLDAAEAGTLSMLHVCKSDCFVRQLADYPVAAINWDANDPTNPDLAEMRAPAEGRALVGGLSRELFSQQMAAPRLVEELREARAAMGDVPFVVGSTCTIGADALAENIDAVRDAIQGTHGGAT